MLPMSQSSLKRVLVSNIITPGPKGYVQVVSQSSLKRVLVSNARTSKHSPYTVTVAILFEASPGFQPFILRSAPGEEGWSRNPL